MRTLNEGFDLILKDVIQEATDNKFETDNATADFDISKSWYNSDDYGNSATLTNELDSELTRTKIANNIRYLLIDQSPSMPVLTPPFSSYVCLKHFIQKYRITDVLYMSGDVVTIRPLRGKDEQLPIYPDQLVSALKELSRDSHNPVYFITDRDIFYGLIKDVPKQISNNIAEIFVFDGRSCSITPYDDNINESYLFEDADAERLIQIQDKLSNTGKISKDDLKFVKKDLGLSIDKYSSGKYYIRDNKVHDSSGEFEDINSNVNLKDFINKSRKRGGYVDPDNRNNGRHEYAADSNRANNDSARLQKETGYSHTPNTYVSKLLNQLDELSNRFNFSDKGKKAIKILRNDILDNEKKEMKERSKSVKEKPNLPEAYNFEEDFNEEETVWNEGKNKYGVDRKSRTGENSILYKPSDKREGKGTSWYTGKGTEKGKKKADKIKYYGKGKPGMYDAQDAYDEEGLASSYTDDRREYGHSRSAREVKEN